MGLNLAFLPGSTQILESGFLKPEFKQLLGMELRFERGFETGFESGLSPGSIKVVTWTGTHI